MATYIALLRGINVSGQKKIKMAGLRASMAQLSYQNIQTYIQSGNIVFKSDCTDQELLAQEIHDNIMSNYGFDVPVLVRSAGQWSELFNGNPFINERHEEISNLYVTVLNAEPELVNYEGLISFHQGPEEFIKVGLNLYLLYPNGAGKSKLDHNTIERKLKVTATSRNWRTTTKLMEMVNAPD